MSERDSAHCFLGIRSAMRTVEVLVLVFGLLSVTSAFSAISLDDGSMGGSDEGRDTPPRWTYSYTSIDKGVPFESDPRAPIVILGNGEGPGEGKRGGDGESRGSFDLDGVDHRNEGDQMKPEADYFLWKRSWETHRARATLPKHIAWYRDELLDKRSRSTFSDLTDEPRRFETDDDEDDNEIRDDGETDDDDDDNDIDDFSSADELEKDYVHVARSAFGFIRQARRPMTSSAPTGSLRAVVDILVVVDNALYRRALQRHRNSVHEAVEDIKKYYGLVISLVDTRYSQIEERDLSIRIRLAGIFIAQDRASSPWSERHVHTVKHSIVLDPNVGLEKFHEWLKEEHRKLPKFDHAMAFTGYSLVNSAGKHSSGMAYIGTVCKTVEGYACSIIQEDGGLSSVSTAAHELGHSLGAKHDGEGGNEGCPAAQNYIMAPGNSAEKNFLKNFFVFSPCTIREFKSLLSTDEAECLYDSSPDNVSVLPGQLVSPDDQCKDVFGQESGFCEIDETQSPDEICTRLWCIKPGKAESCVTRGHLTAVLGTPCATGKVCKNGHCLDKSRVLESMKKTGSSGSQGGSSISRLSPVTRPQRNHGSTEKPVKIELGRPRCKEDTSPEYCRMSVYQRPDLCQRQDMAAYCCFSCSFV